MVTTSRQHHLHVDSDKNSYNKDADKPAHQQIPISIFVIYFLKRTLAQSVACKNLRVELVSVATCKQSCLSMICRKPRNIILAMHQLESTSKIMSEENKHEDILKI